MALTRIRREKTANGTGRRYRRSRHEPRHDQTLEGLTAGALYDRALHSPPLTAAALDVSAKNAQDVRRLIQPWQARAMSYYDLVPEVKFAAQFMSQMLRKVRLFPAMLDPKTHEPEELHAGPVFDAFQQIRDGSGGREELQGTYGKLKFLIGETYLTVSPDDVRGEVWECLSPNELRVQPGGLATRFRAPMLSADQYEIGEMAPTKYIVGNDDATIKEYGESLGPAFTDHGPDIIVVYRLWRPHPAYCADATTEILTESGWKLHTDLRVGERVMTLNHETGNSEWQPAKAVARFYVEDEEMISIEGRGHSSLTTQDHRWPVLRRRPEGLHRDWTTSGEIHSNHRLVTAAECDDIPLIPTFEDSFVEAVAWFYTEGSVTKRGKSQQVTLYQSQSANPQYVDRIRSVLTERHGPATTERMSTGSGALAPPKWREYHRADRAVQFWLNTAASSELLEVAPEKVVSLDFILALTRNQLEIFIETSIIADGFEKQLVQKDHRRLDAFELACILTGRSVKNAITKAGGRCVNLHERRHTAIQPAGHQMGPTGKNMHPTRQSYSGIVWCPNTRNGTWLARRNGTVYYTGNTWLADCSMQASIDILEELVLSTYSVRAQLKSRLNNGGILWVPDEISFTSLGNNPEEDPNSDQFQERLTTAIMAAISDPGTAAAFSPIVARVAADFIGKIQHTKFNDSGGELAEINQRAEMVERFGVGAELPPELFRSKEALNHWSGWLIDEDQWKSYGHPAALEMANDINAAYLQPQAREDGVKDWELVRIGLDASAVINHPDRAKDADALYGGLAISKRVWRESKGYNDNDAMPDDERAEQIGIKTRDSSLAWDGIPQVRGGALEPSPGVIESATGEESAPVASTATGSDIQRSEPQSGPRTQEGEGGPALAASGVPRDALILGAAGFAVRRARSLAGSRLRAMTSPRGPKDSRCEECQRQIDGVANWDVAATLGQEQVVGLVQHSGAVTNLVDGAGVELAAELVALGVSAEWASELGDLVEQHAAKTLYQAVPDALPAGFSLLLRRTELPLERT